MKSDFRQSNNYLIPANAYAIKSECTAIYAQTANFDNLVATPEPATITLFGFGLYYPADIQINGGKWSL